jgi:serine/threonine protein kinase
MLQFDPANRISAKDAMTHPCFDNLDKSQGQLSSNKRLEKKAGEI